MNPCITKGGAAGGGSEARGVEQNEERKKKLGEGEGRHVKYVFFKGRRCGRRPF